MSGHSDTVNDGTTARRTKDTDGLWSPGRRALTIGLVLNVTIVASEALAVGTILPIVAKDLGGIDLYGWVFSGFFLGNLLGIVVAGMLIDRGGLTSPFLMGIGLFSVGLLIGGLAPTMEVLVVARVIQGFGAGRSRPSPTSRSHGRCRSVYGRGCSPRSRRRGSCRA
jgi:MFS family permease